MQRQRVLWPSTCSSNCLIRLAERHPAVASDQLSIPENRQKLIDREAAHPALTCLARHALAGPGAGITADMKKACRASKLLSHKRQAFLIACGRSLGDSPTAAASNSPEKLGRAAGPVKHLSEKPARY